MVGKAIEFRRIRLSLGLWNGVRKHEALCDGPREHRGPPVGPAARFPGPWPGRREAGPWLSEMHPFTSGSALLPRVAVIFFNCAFALILWPWLEFNQLELFWRTIHFGLWKGSLSSPGRTGFGRVGRGAVPGSRPITGGPDPCSLLSLLVRHRRADHTSGRA